VSEPILAADPPPHVRRPILGYAMVLAATALLGIIGPLAKSRPGSRVSTLRLLTRASSVCAANVLAGILLAQMAR
jgi:hypothetical protein